MGKEAELDLNHIQKLADEFVELTKDAGQYREGRAFGDYATNLQKSIRNLIGVSTYIPEICKGLPLNAWDVFPVTGFNLHGEGNWVKMVNDPAAAQGKALRMPCTHREWAAQTNTIPIQYYDAEKKWKLVVSVRCDAAANDGDALHFGIYGTNLFFLNENIPVAKCKGEKYVRFESKPFSLKDIQKKSPYIWFAPIIRPREEVEAVYIDEPVIMQAD